jgi:hypothetical protein
MRAFSSFEFILFLAHTFRATLHIHNYNQPVCNFLNTDGNNSAQILLGLLSLFRGQKVNNRYPYSSN